MTEAPAIFATSRRVIRRRVLWPWDPREEARCAEWLGWLSSTVHVALGYVRRAARYASDPRAVEDVAATAAKRAATCGKRSKQRIGPGRWAIGERYSVADPYLLVYWRGGAARFLDYDMAHDFPRWTEHARRMARPAGGAARVRQRRLALPN